MADVADMLEELKSRALKEPKLKRALLDTRADKDPLCAFCKMCRELGYEIYEMELVNAGEEFHAAMKRSTNGGGENSPMLAGEDDFYELFFAGLREYKVEMHFHTQESSHCGRVPAKDGIALYRKCGYDGVVVTDHFSRSELARKGFDGSGKGGEEKEDWLRICESFLAGYRAAKKAAEGTGFRVYLGMELRFPNDENDFLVYGFTEEFLYRYPWIYMKELPELYKIAEKEGLYIVQAHPFRSMCFPAPAEYLHGMEVFNGNPRHDSHNELARARAEKYGLAMTVGSDFHQPQDISERCVGFSALPASERALARALRNGGFQIQTGQERENTDGQV